METQQPILKMLFTLIVTWVVIGGGLLYLFRDRIKRFSSGLPGSWRTKFVLFAIILALVEEAITTTITNMAPAFGALHGTAYITASTNYLDVILFHSVIIMVPMFIAWAYLLSKYDFSPFEVFMLYGLTGVAGEAVAFGPGTLGLFHIWILIYGIMVYVPAYCVPYRENLKRVRIYHYPLAIILPLLFTIPVWMVVGVLLQHPPIHFSF